MPAAGGERSFTNERLRIGSRDNKFPQDSAFTILFQNCPERQSLYEKPSAVIPEAANAAPNPPFSRTAYPPARHPDRSSRDGQVLRAEHRGSGARADQAPCEQSSGLRGAAVRPSAPRSPARAVGSTAGGHAVFCWKPGGRRSEIVWGLRASDRDTPGASARTAAVPAPAKLPPGGLARLPERWRQRRLGD